jgi:plasminogen activator inhibitor 1 RNA-binding protein
MAFAACIYPDAGDAAPAAPAPKKEAAPAPAASTATRGGQKRGGGPASRGGRYYARGGANRTGPREGAEDEPAAGAEEGKKRC